MGPRALTPAATPPWGPCTAHLQVHWFSILNSLMVVVVMSCIVAMIMMRTIRRDLQRYEQLLVDGGGWGAWEGGVGRCLPTCAAEWGWGALAEAGRQQCAAASRWVERLFYSTSHVADCVRCCLLPAGQGQDMEESGWKMVSGDVFRAPSNPLSLCVQIGSGVQILASGFITLFFAALGFLSPASRGSLLTAALVMYLLLSVAAGYAAVWLWGLVNRSYEGWFKVGACLPACLHHAPAAGG